MAPWPAPLPSPTLTSGGHWGGGESTGANEMLRGAVAANDGARAGGSRSDHHGARLGLTVRACVGPSISAGTASGRPVLLRLVVCGLSRVLPKNLLLRRDRYSLAPNDFMAATAEDTVGDERW